MLCRARVRGQGLVEYALLILLMALVIFVVLIVFGPVIGNVFTKLNSSMVTH
jgi:pilus assembly protein Flp/PilA